MTCNWAPARNGLLKRKRDHEWPVLKGHEGLRPQSRGRVRASGTPLVVGRTGAGVVASRHARVSACGRCGPISERPVASADISLSIAGAHFVPPAESSGLARGGPAACPRTGAIRPTGRTLQTHLGAGSTPHGPEQNCLHSGRRRLIGGAVRPRCAYWDASRRPPAWTQFPRHGRVGPVHRWARPSLLLHDTDRLDILLRKPQDVSVSRFDLVSLPGFSNIVFRLDLISGLSQIRGGYLGNGHATALFGFECDKGGTRLRIWNGTAQSPPVRVTDPSRRAPLVLFLLHRSWCGGFPNRSIGPTVSRDVVSSRWPPCEEVA